MGNKKVADAGYRVLESLKELAKRPLSPQELVQMIEDKTDNVFRKEIVHKYINTFKLLNIELVKIRDKYYLERGVERIEFDEKDLSVIEFLTKYVDKMRHETFKETIFEAFQIIEKSFSQSTCSLIKTKTIKPYKPRKPVKIKDDNVRLYEKYCNEHLKIDLKYKENDSCKEDKYLVAPCNIAYKHGRAVLVGYCYNTNSHKEFILDNITEANQTPQMSFSNSPGSVTFKLTGRLARAYKLKEGENIIEYDLKKKKYIIVSNKTQDKDLLLRRLIRYFGSCEILYPKSMKEKMLTLVEEMEKIYAQ